MNSGSGGAEHESPQIPTNIDDLGNDDLDQEQDERLNERERKSHRIRYRNKIEDSAYIDLSHSLPFNEFSYTYDSNDDNDNHEIMFVSINDDEDREYDASLSSGITNMSLSRAQQNQFLRHNAISVPLEPLIYGPTVEDDLLKMSVRRQSQSSNNFSESSEFSSDKLSSESTPLTLTPPRRPTASSPSPPVITNSKTSNESQPIMKTPPRNPTTTYHSPHEMSSLPQSKIANSTFGFQTPMHVTPHETTPKVFNRKKAIARVNSSDVSSYDSGSISGSSNNELYHQIKSIDELLMREISFTPPGYINAAKQNKKSVSPEEDDGMANELESLARSERLLRKELDIFDDPNDEGPKGISNMNANISKRSNDRVKENADIVSVNDNYQFDERPSIPSPVTADRQYLDGQVISSSSVTDVETFVVDKNSTARYGSESIVGIKQIRRINETLASKENAMTMDVQFEEAVQKSRSQAILLNFPQTVERKLSPSSREKEIPITVNGASASESLDFPANSVFVVPPTISRTRALSEMIAFSSDDFLLSRPDRISGRKSTEGDVKPESPGKKPDRGMVSDRMEGISHDSTMTNHSISTANELGIFRSKDSHEHKNDNEAKELTDVSERMMVAHSRPSSQKRSRSLSALELPTLSNIVRTKDLETEPFRNDIQSLETSSIHDLDHYLVPSLKSPPSDIRRSRTSAKKSRSLSQFDASRILGSLHPEIHQIPSAHSCEESTPKHDSEDISLSRDNDRPCQDLLHRTETSYQAINDGSTEAITNSISPVVLLKRITMDSVNSQESLESSANVHAFWNDSNVVSGSSSNSSLSNAVLLNDQECFGSLVTVTDGAFPTPHKLFGASDPVTLTSMPVMGNVLTTPLSSLFGTHAMFLGTSQDSPNFPLSPISLDESECIHHNIPLDLAHQKRVLFAEEHYETTEGDDKNKGEYLSSRNNEFPIDVHVSATDSPFFTLSASDETKSLSGSMDNEEEVVFKNIGDSTSDEQGELYDMYAKTHGDETESHAVAPDSPTGGSQVFISSNTDEVHELDTVDSDENEIVFENMMTSPNYYETNEAEPVHIPSFYLSPLTETNLVWHQKHEERQPIVEDTFSRNSLNQSSCSDTPSMSNVKVLGYSNDSLTASIATNDIRSKEPNSVQTNNAENFPLFVHRQRFISEGKSVWTACGGFMTCFVVLTVITGIALVVVVTHYSKRGRDDSTSSVATLMPSLSPTSNLFYPSSQPAIRSSTSPPSPGLYLRPSFDSSSNSPTFFLMEDDLFMFLISVSPDGGTALRSLNESIPQYQAFDWLSRNSFLSIYTPEQIIQRYTMATLYFSTNGDNWNRNDLWLSNMDECYWFSRDKEPCGPYNTTNNTLVVLDLSYNNLQGTIPQEIGLLGHSLKTLSLSGGPQKFLYRNLPTEIGLLTQLHELWLDNNSFSGPLPTSIGNLSSLELLDISDNQFDGTIPKEIGSLSDLYELILENNNFEGSIPTSIGQVLSLRVLLLGYNNLVSTLPAEFGRLFNLYYLDLKRNRLQGTIDTDLGSLSRLRSLILAQNSFEGSIPSELGKLTSLSILDLSRNDLTGTIPIELIPSRNRLREFLIQDNIRLSGNIPTSIEYLTKVNTIDLRSTNLAGTMPVDACLVFNRSVPQIYVDCKRIDCPCCNHCCTSDGTCS